MRARRVDKNVKFKIRQMHVGDTLEKRLRARFIRLVYVDIRR